MEMNINMKFEKEEIAHIVDILLMTYREKLESPLQEEPK